ncbi:hypothetical protein PG993_006955 [Apiospora rasikravindrae]|uniref:Uncharacterized protein n=1 Tax=Apiospora rasikravindrae TaxID=990691 RepID=A0ABR1SW40_9PEZI
MEDSNKIPNLAAVREQVLVLEIRYTISAPSFVLLANMAVDHIAQFFQRSSPFISFAAQGLESPVGASLFISNAVGVIGRILSTCEQFDDALGADDRVSEALRQVYLEVITYLKEIEAVVKPKGWIRFLPYMYRPLVNEFEQNIEALEKKTQTLNDVVNMARAKSAKRLEDSQQDLKQDFESLALEIKSLTLEMQNLALEMKSFASL